MSIVKKKKAEAKKPVSVYNCYRSLWFLKIFFENIIWEVREGKDRKEE